jgi:hypothetical protein
MLNDHERETLLDIERRLLVDDPAWIMAFDATDRRVSRQRTFELTFHIIALVFSVALAALMFAAHAPGPALFFATVTGVLIWLIRRLRRNAGTGTQSAGADKSASDGSAGGPAQV